MALGGLATVLGTLAYLFGIVASGATGTLFGRPPLWLLLQVLTVGVIAAGAALAAGWRESGGGIRLVLLLTGGVIFIPWAAYWGLLTVCVRVRAGSRSLRARGRPALTLV
jgi:hypothetical protein